jgi:hypothetical protein
MPHVVPEHIEFHWYTILGKDSVAGDLGALLLPRICEQNESIMDLPIAL